MTNDENKNSSDRDLYKKLAIAAARLADAKKAEAIAIYDVGGRSPLADFVVVAAVDNPAHLEAVEQDIAVRFKQDGQHALHRDGTQSKNWRVLDYGGVLIHLFERQARESFAFDSIYAGSPSVRWEEKPAPAAVKAPAKKVPGKPAAKAKAKKAAPRKAAPKKKAAVKKAPAKKTPAKKAGAGKKKRS